MKLTINIDCTPEEARRFLGLPDVSQLNETMVAALGEKMSEQVAAMTPEDLMKSWTTGSAQGMEQMQKAFWDQFRKSAGGD